MYATIKLTKRGPRHIFVVDNTHTLCGARLPEDPGRGMSPCTCERCDKIFHRAEGPPE